MELRIVVCRCHKVVRPPALRERVESREEKGESRDGEGVIDRAVESGAPLSQSGATPPGPPFLRGGDADEGGADGVGL